MSQSPKKLGKRQGSLIAWQDWGKRLAEKPIFSSARHTILTSSKPATKRKTKNKRLSKIKTKTESTSEEEQSVSKLSRSGLTSSTSSQNGIEQRDFELEEADFSYSSEDEAKRKRKKSKRKKSKRKREGDKWSKRDWILASKYFGRWQELTFSEDQRAIQRTRRQKAAIKQITRLSLPPINQSAASSTRRQSSDEAVHVPPKSPQEKSHKRANTLRRAKRRFAWLLRPVDWVSGTMPHWENILKRAPRIFVFLSFIDAMLRGSGQVFFLNNPLSGAFFLIGMFVHSEWVGSCALYGLFTSTLVAYVLGVKKTAISGGLFGYNGILTGAAIGTFSEDEWDLRNFFAFVPIASLLCVILTLSLGNLLIPTWKVPPFTLPFNFSALILFLGYYRYSYFPFVFAGGVRVAPDTNEFDFDPEELAKGFIRGIGQVFFVDTIPGSILIWIGILICSRISAIFALLGSAIGILTGMLLGADADEVYIGLWGFNPVLGTIAVGGMFYILNWRTSLLAICCGGTCALAFGAIKVMFLPWGLPAFTFPFCVGGMIFILMQGSLPEMIPVDLTAMSCPEGHLRRKKAMDKAAKKEKERRKGRRQKVRQRTKKVPSFKDGVEWVLHPKEKKESGRGVVLQNGVKSSAESGNSESERCA